MKGKTDGKTGKWLQTSLPKKRTIQFLLDGIARLGEAAFRVAFGRRLHDGVFGMLRQYQLGCNGSFPNNCSSVQSLILWNRDDDDAEEEEGDKEESHNHPDIVVFCVHTDSQKDPPALIFFAVLDIQMALRNSKGRFTRKASRKASKSTRKASRKSTGRKRNSRGRFLRRN